MPLTFRNTYLIIIFTACLSNSATSQIKKGKQHINALIGYGISAPYEDISLSGYGFYAQGEYVYNFTKWFGVRPYAGFISTHADKNSASEILIENPEYKVITSAFLIGSKIRLSAPIPWVAPYVEIGIGASIGSFETFTPNTNIKESGLQMHIPFSLGLAIGKNHNFDLAFT